MGFSTTPCNEFVEVLASKAPVPGGGGASALVGAVGTALGNMVGSLTVGKKKYADVEEEMKAAIEPMKEICAQLLDDIKRDSESFDQYMQALALPKETEEEKAARTEAMQNGLKAAVAVPLSVAKAACGILPYAETMVVKGNKTAVTDALVATMMARTAVLGAGFNVKINLESIKDQEYVDRIGKEVAELEKQAVEMEKKILAQSGVSRSAVE